MEKVTIEANRCQCLRCGWIWITLTDTKPRCCARCKSSYWDVEKTNKPGGGRPVKSIQPEQTHPEDENQNQNQNQNSGEWE